MTVIVVAGSESESVPVAVLWIGAVAVLLAAVVNVAGSVWQSRATLKHSRALSEREELRTVIDEAAAHVDATVAGAMGGIAELREVMAEKSKGFRRSPSDLSRRANRAIGMLWQGEIERLFAGIRQGDGFRARLEMRLGRDDQAVTEYAAALDGLRGIHRRLIDGRIDEAGVGEDFGVVGQRMIAFRVRCHSLIGTKLDG